MTKEKLTDTAAANLEENCSHFLKALHRRKVHSIYDLTL
jgi:hypothetical protein